MYRKNATTRIVRDNFFFCPTFCEISCCHCPNMCTHTMHSLRSSHMSSSFICIRPIRGMWWHTAVPHMCFGFSPQRLLPPLCIGRAAQSYISAMMHRARESSHCAPAVLWCGSIFLNPNHLIAISSPHYHPILVYTHTHTQMGALCSKLIRWPTP